MNDRAEALRIIEELVGIAVTEQSRDELLTVGISLAPSVKISKQFSGAAIGTPFLIEDGLIVSDNVILTCAQCRQPLQFRPHLGHAVKRHLCIFCAADEVLRAYWEGRSTAEP